MRKRYPTILCAGIAIASASLSPVLGQQTRSFEMGVSPWPYDLTQNAVDWTWSAVRTHADIVEEHFEEGVPWPEAFAGASYQPGMNATIADRVRHMTGMRRVVSINALNVGRNGLAAYRGDKDNMPLSPPWDRYRLNEPAVKAAYLSYAEHIVATMKPDYLVIGVEVNNLLRDRPDLWDDYVDLERSTYTALKARHPKLPVMVSFFCVPFFAGQSEPDEPALQRREIRKLLPYTDIVGFSVYPYMSSLLAESVPPDYFHDLFALAGDKPVAITESGYPAQTFSLTLHGTPLEFRGTAQKQAAFVSRMLAAAQGHDLEFVCWFCPRDYDPLWVKLGKTDTLKVWRDTGLFDEAGKGRPALSVWDDWLARPLARRSGP